MSQQIHATLKRVLGFCGIGESYVNQYLNKPNSKFYFGHNQKKQFVLTHGQGQRTGYPNKPSSVVNSWVVASLFSPSDINDWNGRIFDFKTALEVLQSKPVTSQAVAPTLPAIPSTQNPMLAALSQTFDTNKPTQIVVGKEYTLLIPSNSVVFSYGGASTNIRANVEVVVLADLGNNNFVVGMKSHPSYVTTISGNVLKESSEIVLDKISNLVQTISSLSPVLRKELDDSIRVFVKHYAK